MPKIKKLQIRKKDVRTLSIHLKVKQFILSKFFIFKFFALFSQKNAKNKKGAFSNFSTWLCNVLCTFFNQHKAAKNQKIKTLQNEKKRCKNSPKSFRSKTFIVYKFFSPVFSTKDAKIHNQKSKFELDFQMFCTCVSQKDAKNQTNYKIKHTPELSQFI